MVNCVVPVSANNPLAYNLVLVSLYVCVYRCMFICMYMYMCMSVCMYLYTFIYTRVWVYICTRVGAFVYLYCPISLLHVRVSQVFLNTCMRGCGGIGSKGFPTVCACCWYGRLCFSRGRDTGFVLYISLFLRVLGW